MWGAHSPPRVRKRGSRAASVSARPAAWDSQPGCENEAGERELPPPARERSHRDGCSTTTMRCRGLDPDADDEARCGQRTILLPSDLSRERSGILQIQLEMLAAGLGSSSGKHDRSCLHGLAELAAYVADR